MWQFLSWFEGFAAFQAIHFAPRSDQPTKWANPLWRELVFSWFHSCQLFCQSKHEPKRTADAGKELIGRTHRGLNPQALLLLEMRWD